ncbi:hypothetical protein GUJ93_ZPchr0011g28388 [Zizania palustris]|uniref:Uncharacterized protein n=1 Tax=Zizania palustris TaxID=103762 RepID=A0A8J5WIZ2_ZIZPA|nr:hypothetical protein GUJ93_ZPchr0011g28388 [Zizania palustris]
MELVCQIFTVSILAKPLRDSARAFIGTSCSTRMVSFLNAVSLPSSILSMDPKLRSRSSSCKVSRHGVQPQASDVQCLQVQEIPYFLGQEIPC